MCLRAWGGNCVCGGHDMEWQDMRLDNGGNHEPFMSS